MEDKWRLVLSDPNLWWDNRLKKVNPKGPDFKLKDKSVNVALWVDSKDTPDWARRGFSNGGWPNQDNF
jgi:dolichyl-phosphate-mannose--protein O-mannosyl transferase